MALTEPKIRTLKPGLKDLWTTDGHGLRLLAKPNGSRYWRFSYRFGKKKNRKHSLVSLYLQVVNLLEQIREITGRYYLVCASERIRNIPMKSGVANPQYGV